jgi:hypothetical protein
VGHAGRRHQGQQAAQQARRRADLSPVGRLPRRRAEVAAEQLVGTVDEVDLHALRLLGNRVRVDEDRHAHPERVREHLLVAAVSGAAAIERIEEPRRSSDTNGVTSALSLRPVKGYPSGPHMRDANAECRSTRSLPASSATERACSRPAAVSRKLPAAQRRLAVCAIYRRFRGNIPDPRQANRMAAGSGLSVAVTTNQLPWEVGLQI